MLKKYNFFINNHILTYENIIDIQTEKHQSSITFEKLEFDIKRMLETGYTIISLKDYYTKLKYSEMNETDEKYFSVVILNYTNEAQKILALVDSLNIPISIFLNTTNDSNMESLSDYKNNKNISIYPMWSFGEDYTKFSELVNIKTNNLNILYEDVADIFAFAGCKNMYVDELNKLGFKLFLANRYNYKAEYIEKYAIPTVTINVFEDVIDMLDEHRAYYSGMFSIYFNNKNSINENVDSVSLPIDKYPIIRNYLHNAVPISIIGAKNADRAFRLAINEFIDVIFKPSCELYDYNNDLFERWDSLICFSANRDILTKNEISIVEYIKNALQLGYYCDVWLDSFYIPGKLWYNKYHHTHGILVYGYNNDEKVFQCLTYDDKQKFDDILVCENDMLLGTSSIYFWKIRLVKNNPNYGICYNIGLLYRKLKDYAEGICRDDPSRREKESLDQSVQINAGKAFAEEINVRYRANKYIPIQLVYSYIEHKRLMFLRIKYICNRENFSYDEELDMQITKITEWLINASMKFNVVPNDTLLTKIFNQMQMVNYAEEKLILELIKFLENKYPWIL